MLSKSNRLCSKLKTLLGVTTRNNLVLFSTSKTFVSDHFVPEAEDMQAIVDALGSETRAKTEGEIEVKICNLCTKGNKQDLGNLWKLLLRKNGSYFCYRCSKGDINDDAKISEHAYMKNVQKFKCIHIDEY